MAPATAVVAANKSWGPGPRIIIPISDERPRCGDAVNNPELTSDADAVAIAADISRQHQVIVTPVIDGSRFDLSGLARDLASGAAPRGTVFSLQPSTSSLANHIADFVAGTCPADCNANGVIDSCDITSGASCDTDRDGVPDECGSCCDNGTCTNAIASTCSGTFHAGSTCDQCACDVLPCCEGSTCSVQTDCACVAIGGHPAVGFIDCGGIFSPEPCVTGACCKPTECLTQDQFGAPMGEAVCDATSGVYFGGATCGEPLLCPLSDFCPPGTILEADPIDGIVYNPADPIIDARHPHPSSDNSIGARVGIGTVEDPIVITLGFAGSGGTQLGCWDLFETGVEITELRFKPISSQAPQRPSPRVNMNSFLTARFPPASGPLSRTFPHARPHVSAPFRQM